MGTSADNHDMNCVPVLRVHYAWNGETRNRCFCVKNGEPVLVDCNVAREKHSARLRGLGDVIAAATSAIGISPCAGCKERQEALNKLVPFENKETNGN
jgi:hypothetical protein